VSGPLLDRIDLHVEVPAVPFRDLAATGPTGETSATVRARTVAAARIQADRLAGTGGRFNGRMDARAVRRWCRVPPDASRMLEAAMDRLGLSARALDRVLKVARTLADLDGADAIATVHVSEAVSYRLLDRVAT
jgi:magnesium chelatase family protein